MTALAITLAALLAGALAMLFVEQSRTRQANASERITAHKNEQLEDANETLKTENAVLAEQLAASKQAQRRDREALELERAHRAEKYEANAKTGATGGGAAVADALGLPKANDR